jgi:sugar transferase EpsL
VHKRRNVEDWFVHSRDLRRAMPFAKRAFDIVVASLALFVLSPLIAVIAVLVRLNFGAPVLFSQQRPGLGGRPFTIWKFRTMPDLRDVNGRMRPDAQRLTTFGQILRSTSLDELPELLNVLRGEMSLVGPRPLLMEYLPYYTSEQQRRHEALPGITGWAQIHGRNSVVFSERLKLDVWYVDHACFALDLKILWRTFAQLIRWDDVRLEQELGEEIDDLGLHPSTRRKLAIESAQTAALAPSSPLVRECAHGTGNSKASTLITLLITGVGGPVGQAILKAARRSTVPCRIVGTDRLALSVGLGWVDQPYVIPDASKPSDYLAEMRRICAVEKVSLILPASDGELILLAQNAGALRTETGATVVSSSMDVLDIALNKWETCRFLERAGLNFPRATPLDRNGSVSRLVDEVGFPLFAKPCRGSGSRGLLKIRSWEDIRYLRMLGVEYVIQEYLRPDDEEYTVAVYTQQDGRQTGSICFKRELAAGNTYRAWVDDNAAVQAEAKGIVRALNSRGPCNVQLRLTNRGPVAFEINPRISGTTGMRAHFGYNEVEMAIRDLVLNEPVPPPIIKPGIALRFWDETYLDGQTQSVTPTL